MPAERRSGARATAISVLVGVPSLLLAVVLIVGSLVAGPGTGDTGGAGVTEGTASTDGTGAEVGGTTRIPPPTGSPTSVVDPAVGVDSVPYDHATWCSPERGDCVTVELPRVEGFGGGSVVTRMPLAADSDGCWRALAADFWVWYCPPGATVDTGFFGDVDVHDAEVERLYIKFKNLEAWRYLRTD